MVLSEEVLQTFHNETDIVSAGPVPVSPNILTLHMKLPLDFSKSFLDNNLLPVGTLQSSGKIHGHTHRPHYRVLYRDDFNFFGTTH